MASGQVSPKVGKVIDIPANAPTIGTATDLVDGGKVSVPFTAPSTTTGGPIFSYRAVSNPGSIVGTGTSSPITVSGLTNDTAYTFIVAGVNATGAGPYSAASNSATPTVPPTAYESIASATGTGSGGNITFSSIPSTFKHLQLRWIGKDTFGPGFSAWYPFSLRLNGDTGNNYSAHRIVNEGGTIYSYGNNINNNVLNNFGVVTPTATYLNNIMGVGIIDIYDYSSTTKNKTLTGFSGVDTNSGTTDQTPQINLSSGLWNNTNAITSISIQPPVSGFTTTTVFSLYGIRG